MDSSVARAESSSSSPNFKQSYDVFLSFRGEDTRSNFTSHLDTALRQKGVNVFIDDKLDRGEKISESLLKTIEEARISIVIFSENYASSTWCLDELVKIIECNKSKGHIVLPVFYKVDPSHVRKQTGRFGEALAKHQAKFMTKIQIWREALTTAANLSGWDLRTSKTEADLIRDLIREVMSKVNPIQLSVAKYPVGIDSQLAAMKFASLDASDGVYMVGIHGIGGIGKTTLAKALFNKIVHQFEGCSFLSNVREASQSNGLVQLQEKLLSEILKEDWKVGHLDRGINIIRERLCSKKVLIVLDDVDELGQLDALVGSRDWFGRGSKIIATTRNKHLLFSHDFDEMHEIPVLDYDKALELFSWHAFKQNHASSNYLDLSELAVGYCKGLPLALVVLGSLLCKKDQPTWKSKLDELENSPLEGVQKILQISFVGLEHKVKEIFLDISCLFVGEKVDSIKNMLNACDLNLDFGIDVLMDRSLVTIENGKVQMHDLIQQMGQTIVYSESSEPGKRSRLWVPDEVINMLEENSGTNAVKAIKLDLRSKIQVDIDASGFRNMRYITMNGKEIVYGESSEPEKRSMTWVAKERIHMLKEDAASNKGTNAVTARKPDLLVEIDAQAFRNMKNLRLLVLRNVTFSTNLEHGPNNLKWIECSKFQFPSLPASFFVKNLVGLNVQHSCITHLGKSFQNCKRLKYVDLSYCYFLEEILDFSAALNLEKLYLRDCGRLKMIHESDVSLSKLITLDLDGCENLEKLPSYLISKSLEVLNLTSCRKLEEISDLFTASNLKELHLGGCSNLRILPESVGSLDKLVTLDLRDCSNLEKLPSYLIPKSLEVLNLTSCKKLEEIPDLFTASNLKELHLGGCSNLRIIAESVGSLDKLVTLNLRDCSNLEKLPSFRLKSLEDLNLSKCSKLEQVPEFDENMKSLRKMVLDSTAIKELPSSIGNLTELERLSLVDCTNLIALPSTIYLLKSLEELHLRGCCRLDMFPQPSSLNFPQEIYSKLTLLDLENCNISNADFLETLCNACTFLCYLTLSGNKFSRLPACLHNFTSLRELYLRNCKFLQEIPNLPQCIQILDAVGCESLFISSDIMADIIFNKQDFECGGSIEKYILIMNLNSIEIPEWFSHQTTSSSISVSYPNTGRGLAICAVFKVDGDSCEAEAHISFCVSTDDKSPPTWTADCPSSKSEYMWLLMFDLPQSEFRSLVVGDRLDIKVRVVAHSDNATVTIRSIGVHIDEGLHAIQTVEEGEGQSR